MEAKPDIRYRLAHRTPFFYGWIIVGAAFLGSFAGGGLQSFTFGVFIKPMSEDMNWSRAALVGALTVRTYVSAALAPIFGTVVDRYGPRYLMTASAVIGGIAALLLTQVREIWQFYAIFALIGLAGGTGAGALVVQATVVKWFVRLRGRAVAFSTMGNAAAGAVLAPFIGFIIATSGWENGWIVMAVLFFVFLLPVSFLMVRQPEDVGLFPDGAKSQEELDATYQRRAGRESAVSWRLKEALRTRALWIILLAQVVGGAPVSSVVLHEFSFVTDEGFNTAVAAAVLSTHAVAASLARLLWGFLVERYHVRYCLAASSSGSAVGLVFLLSGLDWGITPLLFIFGVVYGINVGGQAVLTSVVTANYFGRDFVGTIRGTLMPITTTSVALGPVAVGLVYDVMGTYFPAYIFMVGMFLVSATIILFAKPPTKAAEPSGEAAPAA